MLLRDTRVADILLNAMFADIAMTAINLHGDIGDFGAGIGEEGFDDWRHQSDEIIRLLTGRFIWMFGGDIEFFADPAGERPAAFLLGAIGANSYCCAAAWVSKRTAFHIFTHSSLATRRACHARRRACWAPITPGWLAGRYGLQLCLRSIAL